MDLVPDSTKDAIAEEVAEQALEGVTGAEIDVDDGKLSIKNDKGEMHFGEGAQHVDERVPIKPFASCAVQGSATVREDKVLNSGFTQPDCDASVDELATWFAAQFDAAGVEPARHEIASEGSRMVQFHSENQAGRWDELSVAIVDTPEGKRSVVVLIKITEP